MNTTIRIVIADESPIFRDGLRRLLAGEPRLVTIADTSSVIVKATQ